MDLSSSPLWPCSWWNPSIGTNSESSVYKSFCSLHISDPSRHQPNEPSVSLSSVNHHHHRSLCRATAKTLKSFATYKTATIFFDLINAFVTHLFKPVCLHPSSFLYLDRSLLACGHELESAVSSTVDWLPAEQWSNHHASMHEHSQAFRTRSSRQFLLWRALQELWSPAAVREIDARHFFNHCHRLLSSSLLLRQE